MLSSASTLNLLWTPCGCSRHSYVPRETGAPVRAFKKVNTSVPRRCWLFKAAAISSMHTAISVLLLPRCCSLQYFCYFCLEGLKLAIIICEMEETNNCTEAFSSKSNLNLQTAKITYAITLYIIYIILII